MLLFSSCHSVYGLRVVDAAAKAITSWWSQCIYEFKAHASDWFKLSVYMTSHVSIIINHYYGHLRHTAFTMSTEAPPAGFSSSVCQGQPIRWKLALKGGELKFIWGSDWKAAPKSTSPGWVLFSVNDWKLCWVKK